MKVLLVYVEESQASDPNICSSVIIVVFHAHASRQYLNLNNNKKKRTAYGCLKRWERKHMAVKENTEQHERDTLALLDSHLMCEGISFIIPSGAVGSRPLLNS